MLVRNDGPSSCQIVIGECPTLVQRRIKLNVPRQYVVGAGFLRDTLNGAGIAYLGFGEFAAIGSSRFADHFISVGLSVVEFVLHGVLGVDEDSTYSAVFCGWR